MTTKLIYQDIEKMLEGSHTLDSIIRILNENGINTDKKRSIYILHRLRKKGYVKTKYLSNKKRVYNISFENSLNGISYTEIINKFAPLGIYGPEDYIIYGREPSLEETLIYAIKTRSIRTLTACLGLFKKINNWNLLYNLAKKENLEREVGALYDVARLVIKTRKMPKRFLNLSLPEKNDKYKYLKEGFKSASFQNIEKKWKVYIPLNIGDLEEYPRR